MAKDLNPKCQMCRRAGEKLFLKGERCASTKCAIVKRNYPPGFHGAKGRQRLSDYGSQLYEKQKVKRSYGLLEKQFRITFEKAKKQKGDIGRNLLKTLELRLDNVVYRLGYASSRSQARQLVNHGHFTVNGRKVNIPSFVTKTNDVVKPKESSKRNKYFKAFSEKALKAQTPGWIDFDKKEQAAKILHQPTNDDVKFNFNMAAIVEFYSR